MSDIDLVPASYRRYLRVRRWVRNFLLIYAAVVVLVIGAKGYFSHGINAESSEIQRLRMHRSDVLRQKARLEELENSKSTIEERLAVLEGLRGGAPVERIFLTVDGTMQGKVWFTDWSFKRAGEVVEVKPRTVKTGYFIVIPKDGQDSEQRAWRMHTHMEIKGQALDHSALAAFVQRLAKQTEIEDIRVLDTRVQRYTQSEVVNFELAVVVEAGPAPS